MEENKKQEKLSYEQLEGIEFTCQLLGTPNPYAN